MSYLTDFISFFGGNQRGDNEEVCQKRCRHLVGDCEQRRQPVAAFTPPRRDRPRRRAVLTRRSNKARDLESETARTKVHQRANTDTNNPAEYIVEIYGAAPIHRSPRIIDSPTTNRVGLLVFDV